MPILMDKILAEYVDQAYEVSRLGRNGAHTTRALRGCRDARRTRSHW